MKKLNRGSYIDASCQVWLHFAKQFQWRRFFITVANQKQELPLAAYLLAEWDEMKKLYRGSYIDAFCQVWFHLVQLFQRSSLKYETLTDGRRTPSEGNTSHDPLGQVS